MSLMLQAQNTFPKFFDELLARDVFWPSETRRAFGERTGGYGLGAVDIEDEEQLVRIRMDVPGVRKEDLAISYERGMLIVSGERKSERKEESACGTCHERAMGRFERRFSLGEKLDSERIDAKIDNGVLEITLPKREDVKPKAIAIN